MTSAARDPLWANPPAPRHLPVTKRAPCGLGWDVSKALALEALQFSLPIGYMHHMWRLQVGDWVRELRSYLEAQCQGMEPAVSLRRQQERRDRKLTRSDSQNREMGQEVDTVTDKTERGQRPNGDSNRVLYKTTHRNEQSWDIKKTKTSTVVMVPSEDSSAAFTVGAHAGRSQNRDCERNIQRGLPRKDKRSQEERFSCCVRDESR